MDTPTSPINDLILHQLALGEKGFLVLVVAVRKSLNGSKRVKGDLPVMVKSALRKLVTSKVVVDVDGVYALTPK